MEALSLSFSAALLMGFAFGAGPCNVACLPYLGPVFMARPGGIAGSWRTILPFSAGRVAGYSTLGAVAGAAGQVATGWLEKGAATWFLGGATMAVGLVLVLRRGGRSNCATEPHPPEQAVVIRREPALPGNPVLPAGLFGMGAAMALNPCVPLGTVLLAAAATASAGAGMWLGFGFGVGAVLIPSLLFGILVAHFGAQIRANLAQWGRAVERSAGGLLILLGGLTAMGWIQP